MAGMYVLSDTLKGGNKLEKSLTPKGKTAAENDETPTTGFAEALSSSINLQANSKGQNSKAGLNSEEKQSVEDPVHSNQNQNGLGNTLEYGNFLLPFLAPIMLQSDLPAGKEANSGNVLSQGTEDSTNTISSLPNILQAAGSNLGMDVSNLLSLVSDGINTPSGMTVSKSQGETPTITELDNYKEVIVKLLEKLSGEINDLSSKGNTLSSESAGINNLSQDMAKTIQGWMTTIDEIAKAGQPSSVQKGIPTELDDLSEGTGAGNYVLTSKLSALLSALNPKLSQVIDEVGTTKTSKETNAAIQADGVSNEPVAKGSPEPLLKPQKGSDIDLVETPVNDIAQRSQDLKKSTDMGPHDIKNLKVSSESLGEEVQQRYSKQSSEPSGIKGDPRGDSQQPTEPFGLKEVQNQNSSAGIGVASNVILSNVADGKTAAVPVWEQISTVLREQAMNRSLELKHLDIQLHPADLGKIQIDLHWDNGQVHLQVQASETATSQLLQNHLSDLRQAITNQGVDCGMLQMGQGGERQQNSRRDDSGRSLNQNPQLNEDEELISGTNPLTPGQNGTNRINVTA